MKGFKLKNKHYMYACLFFNSGYNFAMAVSSGTLIP